MNSYILYGSTICSDIPFPQLVEANASQNDYPHIVIQAGKIPEEIKLQEKECKYNFGEMQSWLINSTAWLLVEEGNRVTYELRENGNIDYLRTYILGYAMSMLYLQRGEMSIHCSAVSNEGEAILIAGDSGSGKSTVTDALLGAGYVLMADDMAIVRRNELGIIMVAPGFPYQKLCRDVVNKSGYYLEDLIHIYEDKDKFLVPYQGEFCVKEKPLKAIFILIKTDSIDKLLVEELKGMDKFHACVNNLFLKRFLQRQRYTAYIGKACLDIASQIPIYLVYRPFSENTLNEIIDYIVSITD